MRSLGFMRIRQPYKENAITMSVVAKFKVNSTQSTLTQKQNAEGQWEKVEMRTISLNPVYSNNPDDENRKFWDASPSGEIKLGVINPQAWPYFELGAEYYVEFKKAE